LQLTAICAATRSLFLGETATAQLTDSSNALLDDRVASPPSFLNIQVGNDTSQTQFIWGDVLKGIEELSHNITAALLTLRLGTTTAECSFDQHIVAYRYTSFALWVPYGVSNFSLLSRCNLTFSSIFFVDSLGHFSSFTRCRRHDDGEK